MSVLLCVRGGILPNTLQRWLCSKYNKDEGGVRHDFNSRVAVDLRTCYCIKDEYLTKHETSDHYVGIADFDLASATADLPDQEQQKGIQNHRADRLVNAVWINYTAKWAEFAPGDRSMNPHTCGTTTQPFTTSLNACQIHVNRPSSSSNCTVTDWAASTSQVLN